MQQVKAFLTVLVTFITFIFTSVIIGYVIGFIAVLLNSGGMFTPWKPLPSPMEFIQIKDATSHIIWTQSKDGKYYAWDSYCFDQAKCNEWVEVKDIPDNLHTGGERSVKRGATCGELGFDYLTSNLPKNVRECVKTGFAGPEFGTSVYYALLDNGQIWMWEHGTSLIEIQVLPLLCGFLGLFAGIIGFVVFMIRRITKNKQSTASPVNIPMPYEPVIGLEVHAELATHSKMFCACAVVDNTVAPPNSAVCPVCAGMPGTLPVVNQMAVEMGIRVALALGCTVNPVSVFARKNYFYPDLPKGYQISQYEQPLAEHGQLAIQTSQGERTIRIRRVHLEEDTGKLTHVEGGSLLDLNRAGVPLLEIVSEPDIRSAEEAVAYGEALRHILRYLEVNSGDMEKGVIRFEANVSVKPIGVKELGTRTEVKNLNSFRALERATLYEIERQSKILDSGGTVEQETLGWNDVSEKTYSQRSKEDAHDYRYFPEPDLPPLKVNEAWLTRVRAELPELPQAKMERFVTSYKLPVKDAARLVEEKPTADYFEATVHGLPSTVTPKVVANWILGELFGLMKTRGETADRLKVRPEALAELVSLVAGGEINQTTGREVLVEMSKSGKSAAEIVAAKGLKQVSDAGFIAEIVHQTLEECPGEVTSFRSGKETVLNFLFGQVMKKAAGKANPQVVRAELERQLKEGHNTR